MRLFSSTKIYDFMGVKHWFFALSFGLIAFSLALLFGKVPGIQPKFGTDFKGGTEVEVSFSQHTTPAEIRTAVEASGFDGPEVVPVENSRQPNHYLIRVHEVSTLTEEQEKKVERALCFSADVPEAECPKERRATEVKFSPGGDKITARYREAPDLAFIRERLSSVPSVKLRPGDNNPFVQNSRDHKVEIQLQSRGDQLVEGLRKELGAKAPDHALRSEWIGPRAGAQLRDSAIKSLSIALIFIMLYVAFRFDLRFAPGGVVALFHDALGMIGIWILLGKEINLTTVAAALMIVGYSVNDTVVIYDRVRENLSKLRGASFRHLINVSTSEMLGRTLLTNATVQISLLAFFIWGTGTLKDFALSLTIGMVLGTYSTIYVALPLTEWLDRVVLQRVGAAGAKRTGPGKGAPNPA